MSNRQKLSVIRPWDRNLLELQDLAQPFDLGDDDVHSIESEDYQTPPSSPSFESYDASRALRLLVRLGQPFRAFLLAQQWGGEYKRIAADHDIIAEVNDMTSMMDIRTLEIL